MKHLFYYITRGTGALALLATALLISSVVRGVVMKRPTVGVTVFVHGTVGSSLGLIGEDFVDAFRNHPLIEEDQILGMLGLHEFLPHAADQRHSSTHLIPVYDKVARSVGLTHDYDKYLIFGWSGLLSHEGRSKAAFDLYDELCAYRDKVINLYGVEPVIRLITHSHGGNVGLLLAQAEQEKKYKLKIDLLHMLGAPIQVETASYIRSKVFKKIISSYSHGDGIQGSDYFSTRTGKSYKHMKKLVDLDTFVQDNPGYIRCDMRHMVNRSNKLVTHANMWLMGRSKKLFDFVDPLSLVVFVPLFVSSVDHEPELTRYVAHLDGKKGELIAYLTPGHDERLQTRRIGQSDNLYDLITECQKNVMSNWTARDKGRSLIFNRKNFEAISNAFTKTVYKKNKTEDCTKDDV